MKVIIIPDLHGKTIWKSIVPSDYDLILFLGDYVDDFYFLDEEIVKNLQEIIDFKKNYPEKIQLLLGNHDIQYLFYPEYRCSGFRMSYLSQVTGLFATHRSLFQVAHQVGRVLFTHAGVSKDWLKYASKEIAWASEFETVKTLADALNLLHNSHKGAILHTPPHRRGGSYPHGGITWADRAEFTPDNIPAEYDQFVGHSKVGGFVRGEVSNGGNITFCDVLDTIPEMLELEIYEETLTHTNLSIDS